MPVRSRRQAALFDHQLRAIIGSRFDEYQRGPPAGETQSASPVMPRAQHHIIIAVGDRVLTGVLEEEQAPATCKAFLTVLPLRRQLLQARWSGEAAWVPLGELDLGVGSENPVHRPRPGQVLFYPAAESETEILLPYGVTAFAAVCGPLYGNHFLTINGQEEHLREIGRRVLMEGAQQVDFALQRPR
jgi:hypothetical protein